MKVDAHWEEAKGLWRIDVSDVTEAHRTSLSNFVPDVLVLIQAYVNSLEELAVAAENGDRRAATILKAQVLKSRACLDRAAAELELGSEAVERGDSLAAIGFPELE